MNRTVKAHGKMQDVFEVEAHARKTPAMRQAVGMKTDEDRAEDGEKREADPGQDQRRKFAKAWISMHHVAGAHPVDDAAEKNGLGELRARQSEVGEDKKDCEAGLGADQPERAKIDAYQ